MGSILAAAAVLASGGAVASDCRDLLTLEARWNDAVVRKDVGELDRILADDFLLIWANGSVAGKAEMLSATARRAVTIKPFTTRQVLVRTYSDIAIVTGMFSQTVELGGRSETKSYRYTDVYRKQGDRWQAVSAHATAIPSPPVEERDEPRCAGSE